ncbi:MAG: hypothetical protein AVDCRST_MAG50-2621 [uncultured Acidimicrobiales bacterium]|uniref:4,4'-diaponeurosporenoate glycosyltransferase n=1 Tax=uncultured Acidimicrobiales bacterium TaxID=310071 RepID=A0A6J4IPG6_9ACTN|nr:MAG: hypothetical protein AVDCRST_MAG50-2621 [uncultured Acidimicrobiales bacterium]
MIVDCVIPARNEASTVAIVVEAALGCAFVREVTVVDDASSDDTGEQARLAGAKVIRREGSGSKGRAMEVGVRASDADLILFADADLLGITAAHLDAICRPVVEGDAAMSLGSFDYGWWSRLVLRFPPITGERIIPRWVFEAIPPPSRGGFAIEIMIDEVVCARRLPVVARVMVGVTHRTKRDKFGKLEGYRRTLRMFWEIWGPRTVWRWRTYAYYLRDVRIER